MTRLPVAIGLTLCDCVIVEAMTHKLSLIGCATEIGVDELPGLADPLSVVAFMADAQGVIDLELRISSASTRDVLQTYEQRIYSPGPLSVIYCHMRLMTISFPRVGPYLFSLWTNNEPIAERRVNVFRRGDRS